MAHASFDERLSLVGLLIARLNVQFRKVTRQEKLLGLLYEKLKDSGEALKGPWREEPQVYLEDLVFRMGEERRKLREAELLTREEAHLREEAERMLGEVLQQIRLEHGQEGDQVYSKIQQWFSQCNDDLDMLDEHTGAMLEHAFDFTEAAFGNGQEMVIFVTELNTGGDSVRFLGNYSCERYYQYNEQLLYQEKNRKIQERISRL